MQKKYSLMSIVAGFAWIALSVYDIISFIKVYGQLEDIGLFRTHITDEGVWTLWLILIALGLLGLTAVITSVILILHKTKSYSLGIGFYSISCLLDGVGIFALFYVSGIFEVYMSYSETAKSIIGVFASMIINLIALLFLAGVAGKNARRNFVAGAWFIPTILYVVSIIVQIVTANNGVTMSAVSSAWDSNALTYVLWLAMLFTTGLAALEAAGPKQLTAYGSQNMYGNQNAYNNPNMYGNQNTYNNPNMYGNQNAYNNPSAYNNQSVNNNQNAYNNPNTYNSQNAYNNQNAYGNPNTYGSQNAYSNQNAYGSSNTYNGQNAYGNPNAYSNSSTYDSQNAYNNQNAYGSSNTNNNPPYGN